MITKGKSGCIIFAALLLIFSSCKFHNNRDKLSRSAFYCLFGDGEPAQAPYLVVTKFFTDKFDLSDFIKNDSEDSVGSFGVIDSLTRLQVYFTSVKINKNNKALYNVDGAARLDKKVNFFSGYIHIDTVKVYDRNYFFSKDTCIYYPVNAFKESKKHQFEEKRVDFVASFCLAEDSIQKSNGILEGKLSFSLSLDSNYKLINNIENYDGLIDLRNFIYEGYFRAYNSKKRFVKWSPNMIDNLWGTWDCGGVATYLPGCGLPYMVKRGWEVDSSFDLTDNPKLWWKRDK